MYTIELLAVCTAIIIAFYILFGRKGSPASPYPDLKPVPQVSGALPLIGHGMHFTKDIVHYISDCRNKYGNVFNLKLFRSNLVVICDREMSEQFFRWKETEMSMYEVLNRLNFGVAFSDDPQVLPLMISLVKTSIKMKVKDFTPKIMQEAHQMIDRMKSSSSSEPINLRDEMVRFTAYTSSLCFVSIKISEEYFQLLTKFIEVLNKMLVLTYFLPKPVLTALFCGRLRKYRHEMCQLLAEEIESYRNDPDKIDSPILRSSVDFRDAISGKPLSNQQVSDVIVTLLWVSAENTALGLSAAITELARHPQWWEKARAESESMMEEDPNALFSAPILDACVMESSRMNSHIFALTRIPRIPNASVGGYYIGHADSVVICEPMLMMFDCADDVFSSPAVYNPARFLEPYNERKDSKSIMTWG